jgi:dTDP-4-amino-4,6-dideoxygalactose transaminase
MEGSLGQATSAVGWHATSCRVPFNRPTRVPGEAEALADAFAADDLDARLTQLASTTAALVGREHAFLTPSCTASLEMAALALGVGPGDEVIVPSFAFVTVASAFVQRGAKVHFADVDESTGRISADEVRRLLTSRTKVVVVIHYAGNVTPLDDLDEVLSGHRDVTVIEDCAHSFPYSAPRSLRPDAPRRLLVASFHHTKNVTCGEGGLLAFDDPTLLDPAWIIHDKGTDRRRFLANEVARYQWVALGSSFSMSSLLAPPLAVQLDALDDILERRRRRWTRYVDGLAATATDRGWRILGPSGDWAAHGFVLVLPDPVERPALLAHLAAQGIHATSHYEPLHASPMGLRISRDRRPRPQTDRLAGSLVRLPIFDSMGDDEQALVIDAIESSPAG